MTWTYSILLFKQNLWLRSTELEIIHPEQCCLLEFYSEIKVQSHNSTTLALDIFSFSTEFCFSCKPDCFTVSISFYKIFLKIIFRFIEDVYLLGFELVEQVEFDSAFVFFLVKTNIYQVIKRKKLQAIY